MPRLEGEDPANYVRRRGRIARGHCHRQGSWSNLWFTRAIAWDGHLDRPLNGNTWSAVLQNFRGKEWLMQRRASHASASLFAGRTNTRAMHGHVATRWHDGADYARSHVQPM